MAEDTRKIVRLMRRDLPGEVNIETALRSLKGVSFMTARAIRKKSGFDRNILIGDLTEQEMKTLEKILEAPHSFDFPHWLLNRRKDPETGIDTHNVETNLMLVNREDLGIMKKIRVYRGVRHMFNLPVRGQRTRSTGRKNKTVGVQRKGKASPAAGGK
ncbi:MAG: 30S ribosomal protein S13 [archaeon]